jgi:GT2 family glycosyltransferase
MNQQKICFITCVNDETIYQESLIYINHLILPEGFEVEIIAVRNAAYITKAYNEAMQSSDAKYKVYLHQDIFIINKNFITDVIDIFQQDKKVGMIGMVGAEKLPTNACWWEAKNRYGNVYDSHKGYMARDSFNDFEQKFKPVQAIDGILMITQQDVSWREDLFKGWHFYDISQSIEFAKKGYQIVVPNQVEPWCIHDCGITPVGEVYEKYRNVFLEEYSEWAF